jgi:hypothetical protein
MNDELLQAEKEAQAVIELAREVYLNFGCDAKDALGLAERFLGEAEQYRLDKIKAAL